MTNAEKKKVLEQLINTRTRIIESYYLALEEIGDIKTNYTDYMVTTPIDVDYELKRLKDANYKLCTALLIMTLREDYFSNGEFERRYEQGQVIPIVEKMIKLL